VPEGHTIHRIARLHNERLAGKALAVSSPQGRFAESAARLDGRVLQRVDAFGKHLFYDWGEGDYVHVHLGLYGKFLDGPTSLQVRMRMDDRQGNVADLVGATACDLIDPAARDAIVARLGPDPLRPRPDPAKAWSRISRSTTPIGKALMDQSVIAGVGNVYRAEALFALGIHPEVPARQITREQFDQLWDWIVRALKRGLKEGRIITIGPPEDRRRRSSIPPEEGRYVYKQDRCRRCGTEVRRWDMGGRWAYACEACQPA
jgi:endonuclease-8